MLAIPFFSLRLGFSDAGNDPTTDTTRRAYDLLADGFGPGFNGPLVLAGDVRPTAREPLDALSARAAETLPDVGVAVASPVIPNEDGRRGRDPA